MSVKEELQRTQFLISEDSLQHSGEYHAKLQVLKELNYVDQHGTCTFPFFFFCPIFYKGIVFFITVQMKGKVACEMGNHELMITELVFHNVLTELQPAEIAALLSCLVFQQKNASAPELTPVLEQGRDKIRDIAEKIGRTQQLCGLKDVVGDFVDQFRFELAQVVHKWANGVISSSYIYFSIYFYFHV
jgi:antiviral helicase SKI2